MAEEKGLIALNHCNNIANAIITKLGGTGYKPSEWREKVNLLGISSADKSEVLAGLTPEASGEEAGLIDLETISGLAEELNDKYTTIRGFKPSEMRGAISAMIPLEEKTASGSIAHYTDGAKNTPLTKCEVALAPSVAGRNPANVSGSIVSFSDSAEVGLKACKVTIPASLDGVSSVDVVSAGKNLIPFIADYLNFTQTQNGMTISVLSNGKVKFNGTTTALTNFSFYPVSVSTAPHFYVKNGTYTFSCHGSASVKMIVSGGSNNGFPYREITNGSYTGTVTDDTKPFNYVIFRIDSGVTLSDVEVEPMLEYGSTETAYTEYVQPTTHTANLGRTIHGGTVDVVNGTGTDENAKTTLDNTGWAYYPTGGKNTFNKVISGALAGGAGYLTGYTWEQAAYIANQSNKCFYFYQSSSGVRISIRDDDYTSLEAWEAHINGSELVYPKTPEAFTFPRVPIVPKAGVNTMWSAGDISVDYYKDGYGYEEVKVYHQGANFIDDTLEGIEQGTISGSTGRNVAGANRVRNAGFVRFPLDKLQANYTLTIPEGYKLAMRFYTEDKTFVTPPSWAQDFINQIPAAYLGHKVQFARFILAKTDDSNITPEDIANAGFILNYGSVADAYEPYTEPEEKTKDLGGTVYGGSYDFVAGETEVTYKRADLGALTWVKFPTAGYADLYYTDDLKEEIGATSGSQTHGLCYEFDVVTNDGHDGSDSSATPQPYNSIRFRASDGRIYLKVAGYTTAADMKAGVAGVMLLYQLHEPEAIEGEPEAMKSYFGVNTLWNEENDTTVGYYADIDLSSNTQNALNMVNLNQEEIE